MADPLTLALVVAVGALAGLVSGMFGVGGGVVMVPAVLLLLAAELPEGRGFHVAKAASLLVISAVTALGIWLHRREEHVDLRLGALLAAGGALGTVAAALLAEGLADGALRAVFGVVLIGAGVRLWLEVRPQAGGARAALAAAPALGVAGGVLAGLLGIGGGIVMVPAMVLLGVPIHTAVGTSLVAVLSNAVVATLVHAQLGYGPSIVELGVPLALGAAAGITAGSRLAARTEAARLRRAFGAFLALVGAGMALDSLGLWAAAAAGF